jgi:hypothetical protein
MRMDGEDPLLAEFETFTIKFLKFLSALSAMLISEYSIGHVTILLSIKNRWWGNPSR